MEETNEGKAEKFFKEFGKKMDQLPANSKKLEDAPKSIFKKNTKS